MKKLMFVALSAMMAVAAQAATIKWNADGTYLVLKPGIQVDKSSPAAADKAGTYGNGQLWLVEQSVYQAALDYATQNGSAAAMENLYKDFYIGGADGGLKDGAIAMRNSNNTDNKFRSGAGYFETAYDNADWGKDKYAVMVYTYTDGEDVYYKANVATTHIASEDGSVTNPGNGAIKWNQSGDLLTWTAVPTDVPEPTSAMLLLLGVAGLALKRKRA